VVGETDPVLEILGAGRFVEGRLVTETQIV
jgi:hypothetical protein